MRELLGVDLTPRGSRAKVFDTFSSFVSLATFFGHPDLKSDLFCFCINISEFSLKVRMLNQNTLGGRCWDQKSHPYMRQTCGIS